MIALVCIPIFFLLALHKLQVKKYRLKNQYLFGTVITKFKFMQTETQSTALPALPNSINEILDVSFKIFSKYWLVFLGVSSIIYAPLFLLYFSMNLGDIETVNQPPTIGITILLMLTAVLEGWFGVLLLLAIPWILLKHSLPFQLFHQTLLHKRFIGVYIILAVFHLVHFTLSNAFDLPADNTRINWFLLLVLLFYFLFIFSTLFYVFDTNLSIIGSIIKSVQLVGRFYFKLFLKYLGLILVLALPTALLAFFLFFGLFMTLKGNINLDTANNVFAILQGIEKPIIFGLAVVLLGLLLVSFLSVTVIAQLALALLFLQTLMQAGYQTQVQNFFADHPKWLHAEK